MRVSVVGTSGSGKTTFAARLAEWRQTDLERLQPAEMAAVLQSIAKERPDDAELMRLIAAEGFATPSKRAPHRVPVERPVAGQETEPVERRISEQMAQVLAERKGRPVRRHFLSRGLHVNLASWRRRLNRPTLRACPISKRSWTS